ncbi:MAG TPA: transposase [Candidatus Aquilonibacter sp.]|nr:transposase [Candidatus Aquilonibacter sp.]
MARKTTGKGTSSTRASLKSQKTRGFQPLRFAFEAWTTDLPSGNVFHNLFNSPPPKTVCCRKLRASFLKTLYRHRREGHYQLHAFVVMPEHIHLLLTPALDITIERAIQLIKGAYLHELGTIIGRNSEIWQRGFADHRIRNPQDFACHRNYIHQNPVESGIVTDPSEYRYCSAFPGFKLDLWPPAAEAVNQKAS